MRGLSCAAIVCACFKRAAIAEIGGDPGRAKRVVADRGMNAGRRRSPADHAPGVGLRHRLVSQYGCVVPWAGSEQPAFSIVGDAGRVYLDVQRFRE